MRALLQVLGIVPPDGRKEPVALPAWTRWGLPLAVVVIVAVAAIAGRVAGQLLWSFVN